MATFNHAPEAASWSRANQAKLGREWLPIPKRFDALALQNRAKRCPMRRVPLLCGLVHRDAKGGLIK